MVTNPFLILLVHLEVSFILYSNTLTIFSERIIDYVGNNSDINDLVEISPHQPAIFWSNTPETHI